MLKLKATMNKGTINAEIVGSCSHVEMVVLLESLISRISEAGDIDYRNFMTAILMAHFIEDYDKIDDFLHSDFDDIVRECEGDE